MSPRFWISLGAFLAAGAVTAGAVGTHVLKEALKLPESDLESYDVATRYYTIHALGLILVGILAERRTSVLLTAGGALMLAGILLFSGGIYLRILAGLHFSLPIVPTGGMAWIVAWLLVAVAALRPPNQAAQPGPA